MIKYVALIRGITPSDPNMSNEKLRSVLESLDLQNVRSIISSGNVIFESNETDQSKLEDKISSALTAQLGINGTTLVRSRENLQAFVDKNPFKDAEHSSKTYLTVTFLKNEQKLDVDLPDRPDGKAYEIIAAYDRVICCVVDQTAAKTPDLMSWLERKLGKDITTRTWKTVGRILNKLDEA